MARSRLRSPWSTAPDRQSQTWTVYRAVGDGWPACWSHPDELARQDPARWNATGSIAQYWAIDPETAWCEVLKAEGLRGKPQLAGRYWQMWRATVQETEIADLSTWEKIDGCGLDPLAYMDDDYVFSWALRKHLELEGYRGLLIPSAAHNGSVVNLVLFGPRRGITSALPGPNPKPGFFVEVRREGGVSEPPEDCLALTRYRGEGHYGLEQWLARP